MFFLVLLKSITTSTALFIFFKFYLNLQVSDKYCSQTFKLTDQSRTKLSNLSIIGAGIHSRFPGKYCLVVDNYQKELHLLRPKRRYCISPMHAMNNALNHHLDDLFVSEFDDKVLVNNSLQGKTSLNLPVIKSRRES